MGYFQTYGVQPTTRSFNHVIDAYANVNDSENAIRVYKSLRDGKGFGRLDFADRYYANS